MGSKKHLTWANQNGAELTDSTQGVNKRNKKLKLGHREKPKEQFYRPMSKNSEHPPVATEKPKENTGEITQQRIPQEHVAQKEKDNTSDTRTHGKENQEKNDAASESSTNGTGDTQQSPNKQKPQQ